MPKLNYLRLELHSKVEVNAHLAKEILEFICSYADGSMEPERYGLTEPLKEKLDKNELSKPIKLLSAGSSSVLFKRVKSIRYEGGIEDLRPSPYPILIEGGNEKILKLPRIKKPKILTKVTLWLDLNHIGKKPKVFIETFFKEFFIKLDCDFGFLTLTEDYDHKNHLVKTIKHGTFETYLGKSLEKEGIPGLYWINILGKSYINWFGSEKFDKIKCWKKEKLDNGSIVLQFCDNPKECSDKKIIELQEEVKKILDKDTFFNIKKLDSVVKIPPFLTSK